MITNAERNRIKEDETSAGSQSYSRASLDPPGEHTNRGGGERYERADTDRVRETEMERRKSWKEGCITSRALLVICFEACRHEPRYI